MIKYDELRFLMHASHKVKINSIAGKYITRRIRAHFERLGVYKMRRTSSYSVCPDLCADGCYYDGNPVR